mmetsp:Transcript_39773/g.118392  ORF Transcript_39773/g.118392 Transcript_39773/m.118392 type:complete len:391 (+) Transcript_39773:2504-3676(+)
MEEAVTQDLLQVGLNGLLCKLLSVQAQLVQRLAIVDLGPGHVLKHQHFSRGVIPHHLWHAHPAHALKVLAEEVGVAALHRVVNLLVQNAAALIINGDPVARRAVSLGVQLLQPHRQRAYVLEVNVKQVLEPRTLDLHHHLLAVNSRQVDLAKRRRRNGLWIEALKHLVDLLAQVGAQDLHSCLRVERWHVVLQHLQLLDELGREHVDARRELLPDFDERGAQLDESLAQPHSQLGLSRRRRRRRHALLFVIRPLLAQQQVLECKLNRKAPDLDGALESGIALNLGPLARGRAGVGRPLRAAACAALRCRLGLGRLPRNGRVLAGRGQVDWVVAVAVARAPRLRRCDRLDLAGSAWVAAHVAGRGRGRHRCASATVVAISAAAACRLLGRS